MTLAAFAAVAALTLSPLHKAAGPRHALHARTRRHAAAEADIPVADLYSARAKRRMVNYLRMRLVELRRAGLDRAAAVAEHRLPLEALFDP